MAVDNTEHTDGTSWEGMPPKLVARLRRTILRVLQQESPMTRTALSVQVRPHSEFWDRVLDDLVQRGIIIREPIIKPNNRAAVSYRLLDDTRLVDNNFTEMTPEDADTFVEAWHSAVPA